MEFQESQSICEYDYEELMDENEETQLQKLPSPAKYEKYSIDKSLSLNDQNNLKVSKSKQGLLNKSVSVRNKLGFKTISNPTKESCFRDKSLKENSEAEVVESRNKNKLKNKA